MMDPRERGVSAGGCPKALRSAARSRRKLLGKRSSMARRDREGGRKAAGCFLRFLLVLVLLIVAVGAFAGLYSGATPKLTVESALKGIGRRTPIQIRIDDPQRVEKVRVEVLQNQDVKPVMEKTFEPQPAWKFWG